MMRGASCWTDHKLVRARFSFQLYCEGMRREKKALPFSVYKLESAAVRDKFRCCLENHLLDQPFCSNRSSEENWNELKHRMVSAAEESIGRGKKRMPEWFEENADQLLPLLDAKDEAHSRMLAANSDSSKRDFRKKQRAVKKAVDSAREGGSEEWRVKVRLQSRMVGQGGSVLGGCSRHMLVAGRLDPMQFVRKTGN